MSKISKYIRVFLINFLSFFFKKKKNTILFLSSHDPFHLSGEVEKIYSFIIKNKKHSNYAYMFMKRGVVGARKVERNVIMKCYSDLPIMEIVRAAVVVVDGYAFPMIGKINTIQLWHGSGFKNIMTLSPQGNSVREMLMRATVTRYKWILASSDYDQSRKVKAFLNKNVFCLGSPKAINQTRSTKFLDRNQHFVLFAPTFRKNGVSALSEKVLKKLEEISSLSEITIIVKLHPKDPMNDANFNSLINFNKLSIESVEDIFSEVDLLITDYSSIATDFSLQDKPIIFLQHDMNEYAQLNGHLNFPLQEYFSDMIIYDLEVLGARVTNLTLKGNDSERDKIIGQVRKMKVMFHDYSSLDSVKNIVDRIEKTVSEVQGD